MKIILDVPVVGTNNILFREKTFSEVGAKFRILLRKDIKNSVFRRWIHPFQNLCKNSASIKIFGILGILSQKFFMEAVVDFLHYLRRNTLHFCKTKDDVFLVLHIHKVYYLCRFFRFNLGKDDCLNSNRFTFDEKLDSFRICISKIVKRFSVLILYRACDELFRLYTAICF